MTDEELLQNEIVQYAGGDIAVVSSAEVFLQNLSVYINGLIGNNFSKLIYLLYRLDISEKKLKEILAEQPQTDAGLLIAKMIIDRQQQKIVSRKKYSQPGSSISDEEKW
ncbi:MAG TPA: hypothetical protein VHB48_10260 [Chitinophagaceae bacterium]|nr:hypothetical protein [Chitinophagaceae bacterium]